MNTKRKCKSCKKFKPVQGGIVAGLGFFCSNDCRIEFGINNAAKVRDKAKEQKAKAQRKQDKIRKEKLKTAGDYIKEAQIAVNRYVRLRDHNKPCISCNSMPSDSDLLTGSRFDAGHYRSRGAASHLRFNVLNIHKQCVKCNRFNSGNVVDYRINLINRIGLDNVERLENDNEPRKFTIEYLKRVKKIFNKRARFYEKKIER